MALKGVGFIESAIFFSWYWSLVGQVGKVMSDNYQYIMWLEQRGSSEYLHF